MERKVGYSRFLPGFFNYKPSRHQVQSAQAGIVSMFGKQGYEVRFEAGATPMVDVKSKIMTLPALPEEVTTELVDFLRGFTDHELGHVMHTDPEVFKKDSTFAGDIANAIEDGRIERLVADEYVGCKFNLENINTRFEKILAEKARVEEDSRVKSLISATIAMHRASYGVEKDMIGDGLDDPAVEIVEDYYDELANLKSTKEVIDLADDIYEELYSLLGEKKNDGKGDNGDSEPDGDGGESDADEFFDVDEFTKSYRGKVDDVSGWMKKRIKSYSTEDGSEGSYVSYKENDLERYVKQHEDNNSIVDDIMKEFSRFHGVAQNKLLAILKTETPTISRYQYRGKIDDMRIGRFAVGDERLFLKRRRREGLNTAFSLLIDLSGSMTGQKVERAMQMAIFLCRILESIKVPCEVLGFTTKGYDPVLTDCGYTRSIPLRHYIFKDFNEVFGHVRARFGFFCNHLNYRIMNHNVDGEAVSWARNRLLARREANKFLLVLSDGSPDGGEYGSIHRKHLRKVVKSSSYAGVHCVGIGIHTSSVEGFYDDHIVLGGNIVNGFIDKFKTIVLRVKS